ncbi:lamin tail domain-containing protein [Thalassomonas viridans]|uniref:Lamin tail domain-containing protein n=1 Tax=Thalassomonas viridans TaxID=137584 RepID=A0AAE9Z0I9_9GAMM|nr:lamin tail domain-containing protein [Thalassomonas viridans]WDE04390.1 lamin tail domain-containing protein [Thalassomonas viridans]
MSDFNKESFLQQLSDVQFSSDVQNSWNTLERGVLDYAGLIHQKRVDNCQSGSAFSDWWQSCCELLAPRQMVIKGIDFEGKQGGEYIELTNKGPQILDLAGWRINAGSDGQDMIFPENTLCYPGKSLRIYTDKAGELSFDSKQAVWNNRGDAAFLFDASGDLVSSWRYGIKAHDAIKISNICFDGQEKYTEADEYAELVNLSGSWLDLSGWQLSAGENQQFTFPEGAALKPNAKIRVYTNYVDQESGGFSFNSPRAIWNNKGDTGKLFDHRGNIVSEYSYGSHK